MIDLDVVKVPPLLSAPWGAGRGEECFFSVLKIDKYEFGDDSENEIYWNQDELLNTVSRNTTNLWQKQA